MKRTISQSYGTFDEKHALSPQILRKLVDQALERGKTHIRATYHRDCPMCGGPMIQDGVVSTGLPLEHYQPNLGEVLKNHYMECSHCKFEQGS